MLNEVGAGPDHTHFAAQYVEKLGEFVQAEAAQESSSREDTRILDHRRFALIRIIWVHSAKFEDFESPILKTGSGLAIQKTAGRLEDLQQPDRDRGDRQHKDYGWDGDREIHLGLPYLIS